MATSDMLPRQGPPLELPGRRPALRWQREYWDTHMRDEKQERAAIRSIENNPVRAKFYRAPEEWPYSSARYRDNHRQLFLPQKEIKPAILESGD